MGRTNLTFQLPALADHLTEVLPTALILADDYETENIKMGLECLHHIIENVVRIFSPNFNSILRTCRLYSIIVPVWIVSEEPYDQKNIVYFRQSLNSSTTDPMK